MEAEGRLVVARGQEDRGMSCYSMISVIKGEKSSSDLLYNNMHIVNNTVHLKIC